MTERVLTARLAEGPVITEDLVSLPDGLGSIPDDLASVADADVEQDPRVELVQLRRAMETRPAIDMARGVLMASFGLSPDDAWGVLVSISQNTNTKLHLVADELVGAVTEGRIPKPFRRQLATTITRLQAAPATRTALGADKG
ncbi:ANTAR domain-containing protein [Streptomyces sp. NPDC054855]